MCVLIPLLLFTLFLFVIQLGSMEKSLAIAFNPALLSVDEDLGTESVEGLTPFARTTKGRLGTPLNEVRRELSIVITSRFLTLFLQYAG